MYYDDFELNCGCRMHCRCDKVGICDQCGESCVLRHSSGGTFYPHAHRCKAKQDKALGETLRRNYPDQFPRWDRL